MFLLSIIITIITWLFKEFFVDFIFLFKEFSVDISLGIKIFFVSFVVIYPYFYLALFSNGPGIFIPSFFLQFFIYGIILDWARSNGKERDYAIAILIIHSLSAVFALLVHRASVVAPFRM